MTEKQLVQEFLKMHNVKAGDAIVTNLTSLKQAKHFILVLDEDNFIQISPTKGINRPTFSQMITYLGAFDRIERFTGEDYERHYVVQRALDIEAEGRTYTVFFYNCEDFKNEAWTGEKYSRQVDTGCFLGLLFAIILVVIGFKNNNKGVKYAGVIMLISILGVQLVRSTNADKASLISR